MTLLSLNNVGITHSSQLFANLNLVIKKGERIGLIAANGFGKSSLFDAIMGIEEFAFGDIIKSHGLRIGYVRQELPHDFLNKTMYECVLEALSDQECELERWRVDVVLDGLDISTKFWHMKLNSLSGGWQRMAMIGHVWVSEPDFLLLDEPNNHLDLERLHVLENWLLRVARKPFLLASHDRAFLDKVTNKTLFLRKDTSQLYSLPFTKARAALQENDDAAKRQYENSLSKTKQLRKQAAKLKNIGINSGSDLLQKKTKQLIDRADKIEAYAKPPDKDSNLGKIRLDSSDGRSKVVVSIKKSVITTPDDIKLFHMNELWIRKGERVVLLGKNGTGKTTLLTQIISAHNKEHPFIRIMPTAIIGICDQSLSFLDNKISAFDIVSLNSDVSDQSVYALLNCIGIDFVKKDKPISILSGGQKKRLMMLLLRLMKPNLFILDEPTNHLDIAGQEELENELKVNDTTSIIVSHDRCFIRNIGTRYLQIINKKLFEVDSPEPFFESYINT